MSLVIQDPLLNVNAAAELLNMNPREIRRMVNEREIAVVRRGARGHIKFRLSELEKWIKRHTVPASKRTAAEE